MKSGIYQIRCGKRFYIGSSKDIEKRWSRHKWDLKTGKHANNFMQRLYNKTRGHGFKFEVLISCAPEMLRDREQELIDYHWGDKNFMNLNPKADRPPWGKKPKKIKISFHYKDGTVLEFRTQKEAAKHFGKGNLSSWLAGRYYPRQKGLLFFIAGEKRYDAPTRKHSEWSKRRVAFILEDGTEGTVGSIGEAAEMFGVSKDTIKRWLAGKRDTYTKRGIKELTYA